MMIIGPILVPFMLFKGLTYSEILLLQSISAVSVFVFEIPTGTIADKISHKTSLVIGSVLMAFALSLYIIFRSFYVFTAAEILFGLGMTFTSGADSAILFHTLKNLNREEEYRKIEGKAASNVYIGQGIGSIISSILYTFNPFIPFWISFANVVSAALIALGFKEPKADEKSEVSYIIHVVKSFKTVVKIPRILWAFGFAALMGFALRIGYWLYEPYFKLVELDIIYYGFIFFIFNMTSAFSSRFLINKFYDVRPRRVLTILGYMMGLSFLIPILFIHKAAIVFLALQQIVRGMYRPTLRFYINHQIEDKYRATVISIVSICASLSFALLSPFVGIGLDTIGARFVYIIVGLFTLCTSYVFWQIRNLMKSKKRNAD